jgi:hypothetical protein
MFLGRLVSLVMEIAAIVGVFVEIPIVSEWAFWLLVGAYLLWLGVNRFHDTKRVRGQLILTIVLTMAAVVGIFVGIPIVSDFAFWVMAAAYVIIVASTDLVRHRGGS